MKRAELLTLMRDVLIGLEWAGSKEHGEVQCCPWCGADGPEEYRDGRQEGSAAHASGCQLHAALIAAPKPPAAPTVAEAMMPQQSCAVCERAFTGRGVPVWAFRREDLALVGAAHTTCALRAKLRHMPVKLPIEAAQWVVWLQQMTAGDEYNAEVFDLAYDADDLAGLLTAAQIEKLDWRQKGPLRITDAQREAIIQRYAGLLAEFAASGVPKDAAVQEVSAMPPP